MHTSQMRITRDLPFASTRLYAVVAIFVALDVAVPWLCHVIHPMAGPTLLPMFFFVLLAGLLFGWRAGVLVGIITPLLSHAMTGMPVIAVLPRVLIEGTVYGLVAGLLYHNGGFRALWATVGAIVLGRLATIALLFALSTGSINGAAEVWRALQIGWPGIIAQIVLIPCIALVAERLMGDA